MRMANRDWSRTIRRPSRLSASVINPLTSSDSASAKSKGALLVSATDPMKNIMKIGNKGIINQIVL